MNRAENPLPIQLRSAHFLGDVCEKAEEWFIHSLEDDGIGLITVNNVLAVKFKGRFLGLSLENAPCEEGELEEGRWYYPTSEVVRNEIRTAYIEGERNITLDGVTEWKTYRHAYTTYDGVLADNVTKEQLVFRAKEDVKRLSSVPRTTTGEERIHYMDTQKDSVLCVAEVTTFLSSVRTT
jgi:hypothetical protein